MMGVPAAMLRTFRTGEFDPARLVKEKGGQKISVCLPARDEQDTVGPIVKTIRTALMEAVPLVDEILVVDDHSSDDTAAAATLARVRRVRAALREVADAVIDRRPADRRKLGIVPIARCADISALVEILVDPLEVEEHRRLLASPLNAKRKRRAGSQLRSLELLSLSIASALDERNDAHAPQ